MFDMRRCIVAVSWIMTSMQGVRMVLFLSDE